MAGEVGHMMVDPNGMRCGCGRLGCMETLASATATMQRAAESGLVTDLSQLAEAARRGDGPERKLLREVGCDLGRGLASVVTLLDVRCFVIGGGFGAALDTLVEGAHAGLAERCFGERVGAVRILPAELGADAGWIGAARLKHPSRKISAACSP
jgi:glucokinase